MDNAKNQQQVFKLFNAYLRRRLKKEAFDRELAKHMQEANTSVGECLRLLNVYSDSNKLGGVRYDRLRKRILHVAQSIGVGDELTVPANLNVTEAAVSQKGRLAYGVGSLIKERYLIEEIIGRGGLSIIYKVQDLRRVESGDPNPWVILKMLSPEFRDVEECRNILLQEASIAKRCRHPNIIAVHDLDRDGQDLFVVAEYIEGRNLTDLTGSVDFVGLGTHLSDPMIESICSGLQYLHGRGLVHGDIKPGNVILDSENDIRIIDFGNALEHEPKSVAADKAAANPLDESEVAAGDVDADAASASESAEQPTGHAEQVGQAEQAGKMEQTAALTPVYSAIDVLEGETPTTEDDIYALACMVNEITAGHHPYQRKDAQQAYQQNVKPKLKKGLWPWQRRVMRAALSHDRKRRPTAQEFWQRYSGQAFRSQTKKLVGSAAALLMVVGLAWLGIVQPYNQTTQIKEQLTSSDYYQRAQAIGVLKELPAVWRNMVFNRRQGHIEGYYEARIFSLLEDADFSESSLRKTITDLHAEAQSLGLPKAAERIKRVETLAVNRITRDTEYRIERYINGKRLLSGELPLALALLEDLEKVNSYEATTLGEKLEAAASKELVRIMATGNGESIQRAYANMQASYPNQQTLLQARQILQQQGGNVNRVPRSGSVNPGQPASVSQPPRVEPEQRQSESSTSRNEPIATIPPVAVSAAPRVGVEPELVAVNTAPPVPVAPVVAQPVAPPPITATTQKVQRLLARNNVTQARRELSRARSRGDSITLEQSRDDMVAAYFALADKQAEKHYYSKAIELLKKISTVYVADNELLQGIDNYGYERSEFLLKRAVEGQYSLNDGKVLSASRDLRQDDMARYQALSDTLSAAIIEKIVKLAKNNPSSAVRWARQVGVLFPDKADFYLDIAVNQ